VCVCVCGCGCVCVCVCVAEGVAVAMFTSVSNDRRHSPSLTMWHTHPHLLKYALFKSYISVTPKLKLIVGTKI